MDSRDNNPSSNQQLVISHYRNPNASPVMNTTSTSQSIHQHLPFSSLALRQQQHSQSQLIQQQTNQKIIESFEFSDGSSLIRYCIDENENQNRNQQEVKKKRGRPKIYRGRPRKYTSDGVTLRSDTVSYF